MAARAAAKLTPQLRLSSARKRSHAAAGDVDAIHCTTASTAAGLFCSRFKCTVVEPSWGKGWGRR